jgi:hypothetical protein
MNHVYGVNKMNRSKKTGRSKKTERISGKKIKTYRTRLHLTYKRFAQAVENQRKKNKNIPEKERSGPSRSSMERMEKDKFATPEMYYDTLETLKVLVQKAHDDPKEVDITPETLPIPTDLYTPIKKEIELQRIRNSTEAVTKVEQEPFDGFLIKKRRLSLFEMIYELGQSIRNSDEPKNFYAAINTGITLRFLFEGLMDLEKKVINEFIIRTGPCKSKDPLEVSIRGIIGAVQFSNFKRTNDISSLEIPNQKHIKEFNAYMYGDKVIYVKARLSGSGFVYNPMDHTCIRLTDQDKDTGPFKSCYDFLVNGNANYTPDETPPSSRAYIIDIHDDGQDTSRDV